MARPTMNVRLFCETPRARLVDASNRIGQRERTADQAANLEQDDCYHEGNLNIEVLVCFAPC